MGWWCGWNGAVGVGVDGMGRWVGDVDGMGRWGGGQDGMGRWVVDVD